MAGEINIERSDTPDYSALARIVHEAVQRGRAYTPAQRQAWSPAARSAGEMAERVAGQTVFVALKADGGPVGFMTLANADYVDFAYIRPAYQGRGLFKRLYEPLELHARANWSRQLRTHASLHARLAFAARGFLVLRPETILQRGEWLPRFEMAKAL